MESKNIEKMVFERIVFLLLLLEGKNHSFYSKQHVSDSISVELKPNSCQDRLECSIFITPFPLYVMLLESIIDDN